MATHENEITEPVDLCTPDGERLNPAARGWSRTPLHRANLHGRFGSSKRWDYWAVLAGDIVVSAVVADVDVIALADVWWAHIPSGRTGGAARVLRGDHGVVVPDIPASSPLHVSTDGFTIDIVDDSDGTTRLVADWTEADGSAGRVDITIALPAGHESLNVVIPWSDELFNYTSKHQARPAAGVLEVGADRWEIGGAELGDAWGVLDVGRGRWPSPIVWNWGGGAGRSGERVVGLQFGAKWTAGTGFTENGVIVDGRLTKIGNELEWTYNWDDPLAPWRVVDPGGQLDVTLTPCFDKHSKAAGSAVNGSETHQVFGTWSGWVRTDEGEVVTFDRLSGFAEEARQHW